jgi:hypothetical protein
MENQSTRKHEEAEVKGTGTPRNIVKDLRRSSPHFCPCRNEHDNTMYREEVGHTKKKMNQH